MRHRKDPKSWPRWFRPLTGALAIAGGIVAALFDWNAGPELARAPDWGALALAVGMIALLLVVIVLIPAWMRRVGGGKH